ECEHLAALSDALLSENHRAGGINANRQGNQRHQWQGQQQRESGEKKRSATRVDRPWSGCARGVGKKQGAQTEAVEGNPSCYRFVELRSILNVHPLVPQLEQLFHGKVSSAVAKRDDHAVRRRVCNAAEERLRRALPNHSDAQLPARSQLLSKRIGECPLAEDQRPFGESRQAAEGEKQTPPWQRQDRNQNEAEQKNCAAEL